MSSSGRVQIKKTEPKWSLAITGIDVWDLLQEAVLFLPLQQTLFLIKSGDINLASQYVALTEVTSRCLQTEGGICTWGRIICSLLFRAVKPDLLEICMWVISHSLTFLPFWRVRKLQSSNHISTLQHLYVFFSEYFTDNLQREKICTKILNSFRPDLVEQKLWAFLLGHISQSVLIYQDINTEKM